MSASGVAGSWMAVSAATRSDATRAAGVNVVVVAARVVGVTALVGVTGVVGDEVDDPSSPEQAASVASPTSRATSRATSPGVRRGSSLGRWPAST